MRRIFLLFAVSSLLCGCSNDTEEELRALADRHKALDIRLTALEQENSRLHSALAEAKVPRVRPVSAVPPFLYGAKA